MTQSSTVVLERLSPHIASVAFSNPPANLIVPDAVSRLHDIVVALSNEPDIKVALFSSNLPEFFINHFDLGQAAEFPVLPGASAKPVWTDLVLRLTEAPFISIASIRGRLTRTPACRKGGRRNRAQPRRLYRWSEELTKVDVSRPRDAIARD
jgi:enoyl-CoA hydratase/carnithine racemase